MAQGHDLYPGSGAADELLYANSMQPIAQGIQQLYQNLLARRQAATREGQLELGEEKFAALQGQVKRKQELEDIDRVLGATTYGRGVQTEFGLPDDPSVRARSRSGGYAQDPYGYSTTSTPTRTKKRTTKGSAEPGFAFDPSGVPTTRDTFAGYAGRQDESEQKRRTAMRQSRALKEREQAGNILNTMLGLDPAEVVTPERLEEEVELSRRELAEMPDHKEGFYYDQLADKHRRAITPKQKALAAEQGRDRKDAFLANERLMDVLEGKFSLVGREAASAPQVAPESVDVSEAVNVGRQRRAAPVEKAISSSTPRGDSRVVNLQRYLKGEGYDLGKDGPGNDGVDGAYGPKTKRAVADIQRKFFGAKSPTGNVDEAVWNFIEEGSGRKLSEALPGPVMWEGRPSSAAAVVDQAADDGSLPWRDAYTTPTAEAYLQDLGLLGAGESVMGIGSIEEMLKNPAARVGLDPAYSDTPDQFAHQVYRGAWGKNLDEQDKAQVVEDYKNFYADRLGERQGVVNTEMARQQQAHLEALQATANRKIDARVAMLKKQPDYRGDSPAQLRELAWASLQDDADFKAMQSQISSIREKIIGEGPDWKKRQLEEAKQKRGFETEDTRVGARLDDATRSLVDEYGGVLKATGIDVTNPDGSFKSPKEIRQKIDVAAGRVAPAKGTGKVAKKSATFSQGVVNELDALASKLVEAEQDALARREEKIPEPEIASGDDGPSVGVKLQGHRDIQRVYNDVWKRVHRESKATAAEEQRINALIKALSNERLDSPGYAAAEKRLNTEKDAQADKYDNKALSSATFKPEDHMSPNEKAYVQDVRRTMGHDVSTDTPSTDTPSGGRERRVRARPGPEWIERRGNKGTEEEGKAFWYLPGSDPRKTVSYYLDEE